MERIRNAVIGDTKDATDVAGDFSEAAVPAENLEAKPEVELSAEAKEMREHINTINRSGIMGAFLGDSSISFQVGEQGSGFYFSSEGVINLDPDWFLERGLDKEAVEWAMYHEARHTMDRRDNQEAYDQKLDFCVEKAETFLPTLLEKWEAVLDTSDDQQQAFLDSLSEKIPVTDGTKRERLVSRAVQSLAKTYYSVLYNSLDDVWVNHGIYDQVPKFEPHKEGGDLVKEMYANVLFASTDYQNQLRSHQYANTLLRTSMVPEEAVTVSPEVAERLSREHKYFGRNFGNRQELLQQRIAPSPNRDTGMAARDEIIEKTFLPDFDELVALDLADWQPEWKKPEPEDGGEGQEGGESGNDNESTEANNPAESSESSESSESEPSGQPGPGSLSPFDAPLKDHEANSIDQLDDTAQEVIEDFIQDEKAAKKAAKAFADLSPEERAKRNREKASANRHNKVADDEGLNGDEKTNRLQELAQNTREYNRYKSLVEQHVADLATVWREIIGKGTEYRKRKIQFQKKGDLDINQVIAHYADIKQGQVNEANPLPIYEGKTVESRENIIPEEIQVFFSCDLSGSMDQGGKKELLKQVTVLIVESFRELQNMIYANQSSAVADEEICTVRTKVIGYDNETYVIKDNTKDTTYEDLEAVPSSINQLGGGSTHSELALQEIINEVATFDPEKIADGRNKTLVIELTDGSCDEPDLSRQAAMELRDRYQALTIGLLMTEDENEDGFSTLEYVYGENAVQTTAADLATKIEAVIKKAFANSMV